MKQEKYFAAHPALLAHIRSFRQQVMSELDRLEDALISLGEPQVQEVQRVQTDGWLNVRQVCEYLNISQTTFTRE